MDLRRLVSLILVALLVAVLPVSLAVGPVSAMGPKAAAAACPHDHAPKDAPERHSPAAQTAAFCHQHCAPAVAPALFDAPVAAAAPVTAGAPVFAVALWIDVMDPPPPRPRA